MSIFVKVIYRLRYWFKVLYNKLFPNLPLPIILSNGLLWIAVNDVGNDWVFAGCYEQYERKFIEKFLKEGMTVLDIGAHHGFYTLIASKKVGKSGKVIAFEPSPRELSRLQLHVKINSCNNVKVEPYALSNSEEEVDFYIVEGRDTGCNCLCPPKVSETTKRITVHTTTLDNYLVKEKLEKIDFIKVDVEGAELSIFKGGTSLLQKLPRPVILCEVADDRTKVWGYSSSEVLKLLENLDFVWYGLGISGNIVSLSESKTYNLVAIPKEKVDERRF